MLYFFKAKVLLLLCFVTGYGAMAQTEFPKEFIMHVKLSGGLVSGSAFIEPYVGSLQLIPQYTIVPFKLRGGAIAGAFYTGRRVEGLFGPTLSYKLTEFKGGYFGSIGNLHLNAEHLWGTGHQRLIGGGINLDLLNILILQLSLHRDYHFNNWWWQSGFAFRISKNKKPNETFPH